MGIFSSGGEAMEIVFLHNATIPTLVKGNCTRVRDARREKTDCD